MRGLALRVLAVAAAAAALWIAPSNGASAGGTASVRIVDVYGHGPIHITFDNVDRTLHNGDRTREISVTPDPMGNDVINVQLVKHPNCGIARIGYYFKAGHRFRVLVNNVGGGRCHFGGRDVRGPSPHVKQLS